MRQILCFGDSNTWGLMPDTRERYPWEVRWTGVLQEKVREQDIRILEDGLCGRTTVFEDKLRSGRKGVDYLPLLLEIHAPLSGAVLMLGTNDCKHLYQASAQEIGKGVSRCIEILKESVLPEHILLVSPILLGEDVWRPGKDPEFDRTSVETAMQLKEVYRSIAQLQGTAFLAASEIAKASPIDDEHMTAEGHKALADAVYGKLGEMKLLITTHNS